MKYDLNSDFLEAYAYQWENTTVSIIKPRGSINASNAVEFCDCVTDVVGSTPKLLLVDMRKVTQLDDAGIRALMYASQQTKFYGGTMAVCSIHGQPKVLFKSNDLNRLCEVFNGRMEFYEAIGDLSSMLPPPTSIN